MKFSRCLAPLCFLALAIAPSRSLRAQAIVDVVLRVHARVLNFQGAAVDSGAVYCTATPASGPTVTDSSEDAKFSLMSGSYEGNVDVKLRLTPSHIGEQWLYRCRLKVLSEQWGWGAADTANWLHAQPGSQSKAFPEGTLQAY